jgi:hypothetical protein
VQIEAVVRERLTAMLGDDPSWSTLTSKSRRGGKRPA